MGESFEVVFTGRVKPGADPALVKQGLARLFGQPLGRIEPLFAGGEVVIKTGVDRAQALRYQQDMARVGAVCLIRSVGIVEEVDFAGSNSQIRPRSSEFSLSGVFPALMVCPRCGHQQLEGEFCAQCKVSFKALELEQRRQRKRERILAQRRAEADFAEITPDVDHSEAVEVPDAPGQRRATHPALWPIATGIGSAIALAVVLYAWFVGPG